MLQLRPSVKLNKCFILKVGAEVQVKWELATSWVETETSELLKKTNKETNKPQASLHWTPSTSLHSVPWLLQYEIKGQQGTGCPSHSGVEAGLGPLAGLLGAMQSISDGEAIPLGRTASTRYSRNNAILLSQRPAVCPAWGTGQQGGRAEIHPGSLGGHVLAGQ